MSAVSQVELSGPVNRVHAVARPKVAATNCCVFLTGVGTKSGTPNFATGSVVRHGDQGITGTPSEPADPFPLFFNFFHRTGSDRAPGPGTGFQVTDNPNQELTRNLGKGVPVRLEETSVCETGQTG